MRIYWQFRLFSQLRLFINWLRFSPKRAFQQGKLFNVTLGTDYLSSFSALWLTSSNTHSPHLVHLKWRLGFLVFLRFSWLFHIQTVEWCFSAVTDPRPTVSVWSYKNCSFPPFCFAICKCPELSTLSFQKSWFHCQDSFSSGIYDLQSLVCM